MTHFLTITDLTKQQLLDVFSYSRELQMSGEETLRHNNILFCFEKPSLRTKVGTEVAINQLGGKVIHIDPVAFLGGKVMHAKPVPGHDERESLKDTVLNVSQWCDAIFARVYDHNTLDTLAEYSKIPIVNGLCDQYHPMQALADFYTIQQQFGESTQPVITFIGDANNVAYSLIEIGLILGYPMRFSGPEHYGWNSTQISHFEQLAEKHGSSIQIFDDPLEAVHQSSVIYTDAFVSMGEEEHYDEKIAAFKGYQVNTNLFNVAAPEAGFMHCLPAHRGIEVTDSVIDHPRSWVYQQARNRMVVSKGLFSLILEHLPVNKNKKDIHHAL